MASDASRRWIDNSWSCRIKLPTNNLKAIEDSARLQRNQAPPSALDLTMDTNSPVSRRNQGKLAEAIQSMSNLNSSMDSIDLPTDPDAQATVTDFLDFTEYLPSDMIRSLTLIGNLDQSYCGASANVNDLTKKYGALPSLPLDERANPLVLRAEISTNLSEAVSARVAAHAEASRMAENVDRHYNRAKNILAKLQDMMEKYPSSRDASPIAQKVKSPAVSRPKITLRVGGESAPKVRRHRAPRITVPGEVMAPYELDYESYGSSTEEEQEAITPRATPARSSANPRLKLKIVKQKKERKEATPRPPRAPGGMGSNVHSSVAGISTTNALALLQPPPASAAKGSEHKPWLQLTAWELGILRKRMKKNAVWSPSDTMISRELKLQGRGLEAYREAKAEAEEKGIEFDSTVPPQLLGETVHAEGAMSVEAILAFDAAVTNKGTRMNQSKRVKREPVAKGPPKELTQEPTKEPAKEPTKEPAKEPVKERAKSATRQAEEEAEELSRQFVAKTKAMKGKFIIPQEEEKKVPAKTPAKTRAPARKRKREDSIATNDTGDIVDGATPVTAVRPALKRTKTETPIPLPMSYTKQSTPLLLSSAASVVSEAGPSTVSTPVESQSMPAPLPSPKKPTVSTPILPPKKEIKKPVKLAKDPIIPESTPNTRARRSSTIGKTPTPAPESIPLTLPQKRPTSSRSNKNLDQATATIDRPRRSSTARNTPAPFPTAAPVPEPRQTASRVRAKRPAPGVVTAGSEGSTTTVTASKRSAATRKKAGPKKEKREGSAAAANRSSVDFLVEIDDEGNVIDPDEPRYCVCNRVSFGTMIGCENGDCEKEWFHLECVNMTDVPPRTTKWYCPDCRVKLGIGEKGEVSARGRKK